MSYLKFVSIMSFSCLLLGAVSCSVIKKSEGRTIKGNYKVTKIEKMERDSSQLVCVVYDKEMNVALSNAVVEITKLKLGGFTKDNGVLKMVIPPGKYSIKILNAGNTTIRTNLINFKPYTRTKIMFNLGTTIIY